MLFRSGLLEYKNVIRPIRAEKASEGKVVLTNLRRFTESTAFARISYEVRASGEMVRTGVWDVNIPPEGTVTVAPEGPAPTEDGTLVIRYTAPKGDPFFREGELIGFDELPYGGGRAVPAPVAPVGRVRVDEAPLCFTLTGAGFRYVFDRRTGLFREMSAAGSTILTRPMEFNLYRAPTDNDRNDRGLWETFGYDRPAVRVYESTCETPPSGGAVIRCHLGISSVSILRILDVTRCFSSPYRMMELPTGCSVTVSGVMLAKVQEPVPMEEKIASALGGISSVLVWLGSRLQVKVRSPGVRSQGGTVTVPSSQSWSRAGMVSWAFRTEPQRVHFWPSVRPVSVQVAALPGMVSG